MYTHPRYAGGKWLLALALWALVLGACGGGESSVAGSSAATQASPTTAAPATSAAPATTEAAVAATQATTTTGAPSAFPVEVQDSLGTVTIAARPERIVSLSGSLTEMLFAIDAGPQVVAVDSYSYYPPEAPLTDLSGFSPNIEAITAFDPDLVVFSYDPGDLMSSLRALEIPALIMLAAGSLDDVWDQIEQLGIVTGQVEEAARLIVSMQGDLQEILADLPDASYTYYYELDQNLYSVTSATFVGRVLGLLGLENIADPADEQGYGYPQLSSEYIIDVDPDLIFLADTLCCGQNQDTVAERPGWSGLTAVANGAVVELDDDIASRWGPRIVDLLEVVADAVAELSAQS